MSLVTDERGRSRPTFGLLWCQRCGNAEETPPRPELPGLITAEPMRCDCGDEFVLLRCMTYGQHFHEKPGAPHRHVATLDSLPSRDGRWPA